MNELDIRKNAKHPPVLSSHREFWDKIIGEQNGKDFGTPGGSWINISGVPGSGKTLILLDILSGYAQNTDCIVDLFDFETGKNKIIKYQKLVGSTNIHNILGGVKEAVLPRIKRMVKECADSKKIYVAAIDTLNEWAGDNIKESRDLARELHKLRENPNFILITVAHLVKGSKRVLAGPAQFARLSDANLIITVMDVYRILHAPEKNRLATDYTDPIKLFLKAGEGWQESQEPDFITKNPIIQLMRKWLT
jgi:predicted ATP-dependent serine protease